MTENLSNENQELFFSNLEEIEKALIEFKEDAKINLVSYNGIPLKGHSKCFLDIIVRFRFNCESLLALLPVFKQDYRNKISINLILRAICSDMLTGMYLATFVDESDSDQSCLGNELTAISSEFAQSAIDILTIENEVFEFFGRQQLDTLDKSLNWFKEEYSNFFDSNGNVKNKETFRVIEHPIDEVKLNVGKSFLTENQKFKVLKQCGYMEYGLVYIYFKYYSQFQHFSGFSESFINNDPAFDISYMKHVLKMMKYSTDKFLKLTY